MPEKLFAKVSSKSNDSKFALGFFLEVKKVIVNHTRSRID